MSIDNMLVAVEEAENGKEAVTIMSVAERPARASWADSSVKLKALRDPIGNGGVSRVLWEICR